MKRLIQARRSIKIICFAPKNDQNELGYICVYFICTCLCYFVSHVFFFNFNFKCACLTHK